jgi:hypothetical protein
MRELGFWLWIAGGIVVGGGCKQGSDQEPGESERYVEPNAPECDELGSLVKTCDEREDGTTATVSCTEYQEGVDSESPVDADFRYRCEPDKVQEGRHCSADGVIAECVLRLDDGTGELLVVGRKFIYRNPSTTDYGDDFFAGLAKTDCQYLQPNNVFCATPTR